MVLQRTLAPVLAAAAALLVSSAVHAQDAPAAEKSPGENPLLATWTGPFGGVPPFASVRVEHFQPALEAAMEEHLAEIERIAADPDEPTFANTIQEMERSGRALDRVRRLYGVWATTMSSPDFQAVEREMAPRLAAFSDKITQNEALFRRIEAVYRSPEKDKLDPEQQRLAWLYYTTFARAGARLDEKAKARLSEINQKLAGLFTRFNQNVLHDENERFLLLEDEEDLAGLPEAVRDAAAAAAAARGKEDAWLVANTRSAMEPFLTYADRRDLREKAWRLWVSRGDMGGDHDNNAVIAEILALRAERAGLLGYESHAHWRMEDTMMREPERAMELCRTVWPHAVGRVREEVADMEKLAEARSEMITIEPWDYRYYMEKVRRDRYDLDQDEISQYLQLERMVEGMFWVAGELLGFRFTPAEVEVYHPDVRVWEVTDKESGRHAGLFYFDPYARAGKRSGAWMNAYRRQERFDGEVATIVSNNSNFVKGREGEPVLISWIDAETLFHEFGHALHGLCSEVTYPSLSGTAVARDYVEFPSQILEHWLATPEVLARFAVHHRSGRPFPQELADRIQRASTFNQGFQTVEFLSCAILDLMLHTAVKPTADPAAFEKEALAAIGMPREIVLRHRLPHFQHLFSSDSYSAGYYSYLWSDVLTADAWEAFLEGEGPYDPEVAARLREHIFSPGNTMDPAEAWRAFRGRDPGIDALMRKRGFAPPAPGDEVPPAPPEQR